MSGPIFDSCYFKNVGTIVRGPSHLRPVMVNSTGENVGTVYDLRDEPDGLLQKLGLREDADPVVLLEALRILERNSGKADGDRIADLDQSRLSSILQHGANIATVYPALASAANYLIPIVTRMAGG